MLNMAKPGPPGPLSNCVEQNLSPTTWACVRARGVHTCTRLPTGVLHIRLEVFLWAPSSLCYFWLTGRACLPRGSMDEGIFPSPAISLPTSPFKCAYKLLWTILLQSSGQKDHFCSCRLVNDLAAASWLASSSLTVEK